MNCKDIVVVVIIGFRDTDGNDLMNEQIQFNYDRIKQDVKEIVSSEMERIKNDQDLKHLVKEDK
jgi:hypothetical protein